MIHDKKYGNCVTNIEEIESVSVFATVLWFFVCRLIYFLRWEELHTWTTYKKTIEYPFCHCFYWYLKRWPIIEFSIAIKFKDLSFPAASSKPVESKSPGTSPRGREEEDNRHDKESQWQSCPLSVSKQQEVTSSSPTCQRYLPTARRRDRSREQQEVRFLMYIQKG